MFAGACALVRHFMRPVIISVRLYDKSVKCSGGVFLILNDEGWIITVAHVFKSLQAFKGHKKEIAEYDSQCKAIQEDRTLTAKEKSKKLRGIISNPAWITNHSFWWGKDKVRLKHVRLLPEADLAVGRLEPFDPGLVKVYPTIKDPANLGQGTSLCRLGYPFHEFKASFNEEKGTFELSPGVLPLPLFPIEGIFTRHIVGGRSKDERYEIKFLETSSPGLRGQSGGAIFDTKGTVWAVQSCTQHLPLGFSPKVKIDGKEVEEHQFLNVGWGIHPEVIVAFLRDNGISFTLSDY